MPLLEVDKFTLQSVSGMKVTKTHKSVPTGLFGCKRKIKEIETVENFSIYEVNLSTGIPPKESCHSYNWAYTGALHLARAFVYVAHDRYATVQEFTCYSLHLLDHVCVDVTTRLVSLHLNPKVEAPRVTFNFNVCKEPNHQEWQQLQRVQLTFRDMIQMQEYIKILEPADAVVLAKLARDTED